MPRTLVQAAFFLGGLWLALFLAPMTVQLARADVGDVPFAELEAHLLNEVNAVRSRHHLVPLRRAPELDAIARSHSLDMARRNYLSHETPEGANPLDRIQNGGVEGFTLAAENLGRTDRSNPNQEIVFNWLRSPDHRRNLLAPPFNGTGIGIARAADGSLIYTQLYVSVPR
jgi:uncharacterized protein YkwD